MEHNFKNLKYKMPSIGGVEFGDCCISEDGRFFGHIAQGVLISESSPTPAMEKLRQEQCMANARRIAACVNYCVNISTEELEAIEE